jgi:hypothetical protein
MLGARGTPRSAPHSICPFRLTCYLLSREIMLDVDAVALGDRRQGLAGCTALDGLGPMPLVAKAIW